MGTDCSEYIGNISIPQMGHGNIVTVQDAIGIANTQYMTIMAYLIAALCIYVFYTNFVMNTRFDILQKWHYKIFEIEILPIDVHELAILPAAGLAIISLAFFEVI